MKIYIYVSKLNEGTQFSENETIEAFVTIRDARRKLTNDAREVRQKFLRYYTYTEIYETYSENEAIIHSDDYGDYWDGKIFVRDVESFTDTIKNVIKNDGYYGSSDDEKYITINETIIDEKHGEIAQLCYFSDTDELMAYVVNDVGNGQFVSYDNLSDKTKDEVEALPYFTNPKN